MKNQTMRGFTRFSSIVALSAILLGPAMLATTARAHDAECPYCKLKLKQATKEMDYEVVVKMGNKRIEYRCAYCVIADAKRYKNDLVVYFPSEKKGEPIIVKRTEGKWSAPEGTVFLNGFKKHADCADLSRAFSSKAALTKYAMAMNVSEVKAMSVDDFVTMVTKPKE